MNNKAINLFNNNTALARKIAKKYSFITNHFEDIVQASLMGLYQASIRFDESLGFKFSTYATKYILGEINMEIKAIGPIKLNKKIFYIMKYIKGLDSFKIEDIENSLGVSKEMVIKAMTYSFCSNFNEASFMSHDDSFFQLISGLTDMEKRIVILRFKYNLLQKDISKILNVNPKTVSTKIQESLNKIKKDFL